MLELLVPSNYIQYTVYSIVYSICWNEKWIFEAVGTMLYTQYLLLFVNLISKEAPIFLNLLRHSQKLMRRQLLSREIHGILPVVCGPRTTAG